MKNLGINCEEVMWLLFEEYGRLMELEVEEQSQRYVNNMLQVDNKLEVSFDQKDSLHHDP